LSSSPQIIRWRRLASGSLLSSRFGRSLASLAFSCASRVRHPWKLILSIFVPCGELLFAQENASHSQEFLGCRFGAGPTDTMPAMPKRLAKRPLTGGRRHSRSSATSRWSDTESADASTASL